MSEILARYHHSVRSNTRRAAWARNTSGILHAYVRYNPVHAVRNPLGRVVADELRQRAAVELAARGFQR